LALWLVLVVSALEHLNVVYTSSSAVWQPKEKKLALQKHTEKDPGRKVN
jgi:hypothetical protein